MERMRRLWRRREEEQTIWWGDGWAHKMDAAAKEGSWKAETELSLGPATHVNVPNAAHYKPDAPKWASRTTAQGSGHIQGCRPTCGSILTTLNYRSNLTEAGLLPCATFTCPHLSTVKEADTITLFSMLLFFPVMFYFIINLKKESNTIRNCSSKSPFLGQHRKQVIAFQLWKIHIHTRLQGLTGQIQNLAGGAGGA